VNTLKLKIATRIFNEEYFIEDFLNFYLNIGVDEIHIFDGKSTDKTIKLIRNLKEKSKELRNNIILVSSNKKFRHTSYLKQTIFCNLILHYAIDNFIKEKEDVIWIFPDVDEFIRKPKNGNIKEYFSQNINEFFRTVFIEWYLTPKMIHNHLNPLKFLTRINTNQIKGKIMDLWGDPFYKDYVIHLTNQNIDEFKGLKTISGFHRLILNEQIIIPSNKNFLVVDHLRGVPIDIFKKRIEKCLNLLENNKDEWSYQHFTQTKKKFDDYETFYDEDLKSYIEIEREIKQIYQFDNNNSYFNNVIMQDNINELGVSKPSIHDY